MHMTTICYINGEELGKSENLYPNPIDCMYMLIKYDQFKKSYQKQNLKYYAMQNPRRLYF